MCRILRSNRPYDEDYKNVSTNDLKNIYNVVQQEQREAYSSSVKIIIKELVLMVDLKQIVDVNRIEELRIANGFSVMEIVDKLGYKEHCSYSHKVSGRKVFNLKDLIILSRLYGVSINEFIKDEGCDSNE